MWLVPSFVTGTIAIICLIGRVVLGALSAYPSELFTSPGQMRGRSAWMLPDPDEPYRVTPHLTSLSITLPVFYHENWSLGV